MSTSTYPVGHLVTAAQFNAKLEAPVLLAEQERRPYVWVRHSVDQTLLNAQDQVIAFDTDVDDLAGMHDPVTNNSRLYVSRAGVWRFDAVVGTASNAAGFRALTFLKNSGLFIGRQIYGPVSGERTEFLASARARLVVGDYVYVAAYQSSGGSLVAPVISATLPWLWGEWIAA